MPDFSSLPRFVHSEIIAKPLPTMSFLRGSPQPTGAINPERIEMATAEYVFFQLTPEYKVEYHFLLDST